MNRLTDENFRQQWNANLYQSQHSFVWQLSQGLLDLLNPQPGERIKETFKVLLRDAFSQMNLSTPEFPWYFPGIAEYTGLLEQQGFEVVYAVLFDRPTPLEPGVDGLANWLQVFGNSILSGLVIDQQREVIHRAATMLRPTYFDQGRWTLDYRRLRIVAKR